MADPYGLISSGLPPELAAEAMGLKGKQAIMQALLAQSQQPIEAPQVKGRFSAPVSPLQGIAKIAQAYVSSRGLQDADKGYAALGAKYNKGVADALANYEQTKSGTPAKSMAPTTPNDDEGNLNPTVDMPAVPGNPRKAVTDALINPYLNKNPLITSDLKEIQETPKTRTVIQGDQEIQQERQLDGSWKEVGRGPRFAKQVGPTINQEAPVTPVTVVRNGKLVVIDGRTNRVIGDAPSAGNGKPMSATAQKELIQTDEEIQGGQAAIKAIENALAVNEKAMGFTGAGAIASMGTLLPDRLRPNAIDATQDLDNIITGSALPQLKAIFGGMPTEGERKILLDISGSSSLPPATRKKVFDRAIEAAKKRIKFSEEKAKRLREGSYFSEQGASSAPDAPVSPSGSPNVRVVDW